MVEFTDEELENIKELCNQIGILNLILGKTWVNDYEKIWTKLDDARVADIQFDDPRNLEEDFEKVSEMACQTKDVLKELRRTIKRIEGK